MPQIETMSLHEKLALGVKSIELDFSVKLRGTYGKKRFYPL
jgi:hypothetical protein